MCPLQRWRDINPLERPHRRRKRWRQFTQCYNRCCFCEERRMKQPSLRNRPAFTLVELLVVIGIIAILISVLLPTLASARRAGYKTKCLASLHQIGDGFKMYAGENKGAWPV